MSKKCLTKCFNYKWHCSIFISQWPALRSWTALGMKVDFLLCLIEVFYISGTVLLVKEPWNRCWNTPPCHSAIESAHRCGLFLEICSFLITSDVLWGGSSSGGRAGWLVTWASKCPWARHLTLTAPDELAVAMRLTPPSVCECVRECEAIL